MSVNCSSSNTSIPSAPSTSDLLLVYMHQCLKTTLGGYIFTTFTITSVVFLLPVYIFILHLGFKQWRQQSFSTMAMSHFDLFTYHVVLIELLNVIGCICACCGIYTNHDNLLWTADVLLFVSGSGQLFFHTLTCAERYLAVVHPVTYLGLKGEKWNRARNVLIAFIWLLSILVMNFIFMQDSDVPNLLFFLTTALLLSLILVFSLSVLRVLIRSGPGDRKEGRQHVDQSKLRAFYVIVSVLVVLVLRLTWNIISSSLLILINHSVNCGFMAFTHWISLPCSLLIPLLYLQRKGKLLCCKMKNRQKSSGS